MSECEKAEAPECITKDELKWIERRIENNDKYMTNRVQKLETKLRLLVRILVDKKLVGTELAKTFEESIEPKRDTSKIVEYYEAKNQKWIQGAIKKKGLLWNLTVQK